MTSQQGEIVDSQHPRHLTTRQGVSQQDRAAVSRPTAIPIAGSNRA
ncbi:hypothetical protein [Actinophytocola sp. KF-1]